MQMLRLSNIAEKVTLLQRSPSGEVVPVILYEKDRKKKKKSTAILRPFESMAERMVDAQKQMADSYASSFDRSQKKRTDGWLMDMGKNVFKAVNKGRKKLRLDKLPN